MSEKKRACDAAIAVLRRTDNPAVMWGDEYLLHEIAEELGWEHRAWETSRRVLQALHKTPGPLVKRYTKVHIGPFERLVVRFLLPEYAAELEAKSLPKEPGQ